MALRNKTKIIATVGPASRSRSTLRAMIRAGVDVFRINGSYETAQRHAAAIDMIRRTARSEQQPTAILLDLPGAKFRLGALSPQEFRLRAGADVLLLCGASEQRDERIPIPDRRIAQALKPGSTMFINDGIVELRVLGVKGAEVRCRVRSGGPIRSGKGINLPRIPLALPSLTARDRELTLMAIEEGVDYVGLSFVRSSKDIKALRSLFKRRAPHIGIVAKIEKPEALDDLDNIIDVSDAVMVARGDLGIEMPFDQIPLIQRRILNSCISAGKPSITATQMLESMVHASRPTRAEATDVAQAVWEGTDAVMLSEETSIGINPANAVRAMAHIAMEAEKEMPTFEPGFSVRDRYHLQALGISRAATYLADQLDARAIVTPTRSGRTPLYVSRSRPHMIVLAPTEDVRTARRMALCWGVVPLPMPTFSTLDEMLEEAERVARTSRYIRKGDTVIITSGAHGKKDDIMRLIEVRQI